MDCSLRKRSTISSPAGARAWQIIWPFFSPAIRREFFAAAAQRGLQSRPYWDIPYAHPYRYNGIEVTYLQNLRTIAHLLFKDPHDRPDALLLCDSIYTDFTLAGLLNAGISIADDVDVIAHGNYPLACPDTQPIQRLGYSIPQLLEWCIKHLDRPASGPPAPELCLFPPLFAEEAEARMMAPSL